MSSFGKNIKKIRTVKRMSQQAFADLFGLKRATLGAYEEGRSEPKIDTIIKVANYFSVSIDDILTKEITVNKLLSFDEGMTTDASQMMKNLLTKIPLVSELNQLDFINTFPKTENYNDLPSITLPIKKEEGLLAFVMQDLMMVRNQEGVFLDDLVIGKKIELKEALTDKVYIILSNEKMFVRRLTKTSTSFIFKADHIHVPVIEISLDEKIYLWNVETVLLKRYPNFTSNVEEKLNNINERLKLISK